MSQVVTVMGATGHVGSQLVSRLLAKDVSVRALARNADRLKSLGVEALAGALDDAAFLTRAFTGAQAAFVMVPPSYAEKDFRAYQRRAGDSIANALAAAGVPRAVALSSLGADRDGGTGPIAGLHDFEQRLTAIPGIQLVHLRPTYFMENELSAIGLIKSKGIMGSPLKADNAFPMVATRDIAEVAAALLAPATFTGCSVREILGPRDLSRREAARILGSAIGKPELPYVEFSYTDARQALIGAGLSEDVAGSFVEMYEGFNEGRIRTVQGRTAATSSPTTLETFAREVFAPAYQA